MPFDYTTVGHVTVDVFEDGSRQAGGAAFYSALQATRLGRRTLIVTQGVRAEIESLLEPYRAELEVKVFPAPHTTTLLTTGAGAQRSQRVLAWAGPIEHDVKLDTAILHIAPVAREGCARRRGRARFVGFTPQGLARAWGPPDDPIRGVAPERAAVLVARDCHGLVVNEQERADCAEAIEAARGAGAVVAVTAGAGPTTILAPGRAPARVAVPAVERTAGDLGAGDVFAAAFFIGLADGVEPLEAARFANAAAAVRMSAAGAHAVGGVEEIQTRLGAETAR